jgi:replicative DNA helicase
MSPLPPHSRESEVGVVGAAIADPASCAEIIEELAPEDFFDYPSQMCWRAIRKLHTDRQPIDAVSVFTALPAVGATDIRAEFVAEALAAAPTAANAAYHAGVVRDRSLRRKIINAAMTVVAQAHAISGPAADVLESAQALFRGLVDAGSGGDIPPSIGEIAEIEFRAMEERRLSGKSINGLSTGLADLDARLGGLKPGELTVIGARPSQGKTALGVGVALNIAKGQAPAILFSAEMPAGQIGGRVLAAESGVSMFKMGEPQKMNAERTNMVLEAAKGLRGVPLFVDDRPDMSAARIFRVCRRVMRDQSLAVVVVDYLQLLRAEVGQRNRHEEVGTLALRMKHLARELNVPVILLSQLSRESERNGEPTLAHLKESGDIEAHADGVILIHRTGEIPTEANLPVEVKLIVAKNRNGPVGHVEVHYDRPSTRFVNKAQGVR